MFELVRFTELDDMGRCAVLRIRDPSCPIRHLTIVSTHYRRDTNIHNATPTTPRCNAIRTITPNDTALHRTTPHCTASHRTAPHRTAPHRTRLDHAIGVAHQTAPHHTLHRIPLHTTYHITLYRTPPHRYHTIPYCTNLHCARSRRICRNSGGCRLKSLVPMGKTLG